MLRFIRKVRAGMRAAQMNERIQEFTLMGQEAVENIPELSSLTLHGHGDGGTVLGVQGVAALDGFDEQLLIKTRDSGAWAARLPDGEVIERDTLMDVLQSALATINNAVWVGSLTNSEFQSERYTTLAEAEARIEEIRLLDPEGVSKGEYYIDSPEHKVLSGD